MKKILSTALAIVLLVGVSQAQTTEKGDRRHKGERKDQAMEYLNLTEDQQAKFKSIKEAQKKEMQDLKSSGKVSPDQRKAIHEKYRAQYQSILTPAQKEEMEKRKADWKGKGKHAHRSQGSGNIGQQAAFFKKELNLTAVQESKLTAIFQEYRTRVQEIRSNNNLAHEQKRTQMQLLAQQYMAQGKAILTPEQAKKFDQMKGSRKGKRSIPV
jgi:Spy/CpxP family protein refolding chaperone